ncbi:unnamed protein product [Closterium sp. NIES-64]|nr:unnamed protein product [Closterium sp. NIES-64]
MISTVSITSSSRISRRHFRRSFRSLPALAVTVASILFSDRSLFVPASPSCAAKGGVHSDNYHFGKGGDAGGTEATEPAIAPREGGSGARDGGGEKDSEFWERVRRSERMSWTCHGDSNGEMVDKLLRSGIVQSERIAEAMKQIDRADYVLTKSTAYDDSPQPIGFNVTISAPHMHGYCLAFLENHLQPGNRVLDVGSGSGYLTAVMALLVGPTGRAVGVEHIPELVERSRAAVQAGRAAELMDGGQLSIHGGKREEGERGKKGKEGRRGRREDECSSACYPAVEVLFLNPRVSLPFPTCHVSPFPYLPRLSLSLPATSLPFPTCHVSPFPYLPRLSLSLPATSLPFPTCHVSPFPYLPRLSLSLPATSLLVHIKVSLASRPSHPPSPYYRLPLLPPPPRKADGREGYPEAGPYDAIHVGAAAAELPQALVDQLKPGGRMVIPVGRLMQDLEVIDKGADGTVTRTTAMGVRYVPLTAKEKQLGRE